MNKVAILDLGSNSVRMTIAEYGEDGNFDILDRRQSMVRLSAGMGKEKILQPDAIERALKALKEYQKIYSKYKGITIKAVATAAVRQAQNKNDFIKLLKKEFDLDLRVLSGIDEAEYDYHAVIRTLPVQDCLIVDTGGASVEIILVQRRKLVQRISLPLGAVTITESWLEKDVVTAASFFKAFSNIDNKLNNIPWISQARNYPIVAIGGSNRSLAKIVRNRNNELEMPIHGMHMSRDTAEKIYEELLSKSKEGRIKIKGVSRERGDIIIGGLLPLIILLTKADTNQIIFSQSGLREGVLFKEIESKINTKIDNPKTEKLTIDNEIEY